MRVCVRLSFDACPLVSHDAESGGDLFDQRPNSGKSVEILREDGNILVLDGD